MCIALWGVSEATVAAEGAHPSYDLPAAAALAPSLERNVRTSCLLIS